MPAFPTVDIDPNEVIPVRVVGSGASGQAAITDRSGTITAGGSAQVLAAAKVNMF